MAVHSKCLFCGYALSVADEMLGKKVKCPHCGEKTPIIPEEKRAELKQQHDAEVAEERAKIAKARREALLGEQVSPSHYNHLRSLAGVLLFFGYITLIVAVLLGIIYFLAGGTLSETSTPYLFLLVLFLVGFLAFVFHKTAAELIRTAADIGDSHNDTLQVLRELRDIMRALSQRSKKTPQKK